MSQKETKHDKFLRLGQRRLERVFEELRLVSQLSSNNYESFPEERVELMQHIARNVENVADAFSVPFTYVIGAPVTEAPVREVAVMSLDRVKEIVAKLDYADISGALEILRKCLPKEG